MQGCRMLSWHWSSLGSFTCHYLLWVAVSAECLQGKDTNSAAGMPRAGRTNRWVEALWRTTLVFSLLCSLCSRSPGHCSAASRFSSHVWFIVQSRCFSPPAHSCNRPCWLTCYIKIISTVISINAPQQCKNINLPSGRMSCCWNSAV